MAGVSPSLPNPKIPDKTFFRIGEVAKLLGVKAYVLRYWETEFPMLVPQKTASNQRVYRRNEVEALFVIKHLLYEEKYSIEGARRRLKSLGKGRGLANFLKKGAASSASAEGESTQPGLRTSPEKAARLRELGQELSRLAATPLSRLFHL